jgi:uncharacterized protein (DUF1697 family)
VNLGKQRKLPMPAFRDALAAAGTTGARTYLQSGNIIIESPLRTHAQVSRLVRTVIAADLAGRPGHHSAAGDHVNVDCVRGYHNTHRTPPYFTGILGVDGTERNWRTVLALADLLGQTPKTPRS